MSEGRASSGASAAADTLPGDSAGARLRAAREKQGLHIAALAAAIKVSPRKLEALENDRWGDLPDTTFARALAQTVCRTLKVDPKPVLDRLPPVDVGGLEQVRGTLNTPFQARGSDGPGLGSGAIRPMVWAAGLLMVAAVVLYFLPDGIVPSAPAPAPAPVSLPASAPIFPPDDPASVLPAESAASGAAGAAVPQVLPEGNASATAAVAPVAAVAAAVIPAPAPSAVPPSAVPVPVPSGAAPEGLRVDGAGLLRLRTTTASSWVDARDANDTVLVSRVLQAGETVTLNGALPIRVTIGNAAATEVVLRGQPVDLAPRTRDNVARLQLR